MTSYATVSDVQTLFRTLSTAEDTRAEALLPIVSATLRREAKKRGRDLDDMISEDSDLAEVAKSVTVDVTARMLMTSTNQEPMTQFTQTGLGYSASGSYLVPGGGLWIKKQELARLGLNRQKYGVIDMAGDDE